MFIAIATPTIVRIRAVSQSARDAARSEWTNVAPSEGHDELTAVGAALNDASAALRSTRLVPTFLRQGKLQ